MKKSEITKKLLSLVLAFSMVLSYVPMPTLAEEICPHHVHDGECGYSAGAACGFDHAANCGYETVVVSCAHTHGEDGCTYVEAREAVSCHPVHDEVCGYFTGADCTCGTPEGEHLEDCGFVEEVPCNVTHEGCSCTESQPASGECNHICSAATGCELTENHVCAHTVCDESCGYVQSQPCNYDPATCAACAAEKKSKPMEQTITTWHWVDECEIISTNGAYITLPNATDWDTLQSILPLSIMAMVYDEEVNIPVSWKCPDFPKEGIVSGSYELKAELPEGYALSEEAEKLKQNL